VFYPRIFNLRRLGIREGLVPSTKRCDVIKFSGTAKRDLPVYIRSACVICLSLI
jgi:hypothetical protein